MNRPCDRCSAGSNWDSDSEYNQSLPAYCTEVHIGFGIVSWLCFDCRKGFHVFMRDSPLMRDHSKVSMELDFWKARINHDTPDDYLIKGQTLLERIELLESCINHNIDKWLASCD